MFRLCTCQFSCFYVTVRKSCSVDGRSLCCLGVLLTGHFHQRSFVRGLETRPSLDDISIVFLQAMLMEEAGQFEQALKQLKDNGDRIVSTTNFWNMRIICGFSESIKTFAALQVRRELSEMSEFVCVKSCMCRIVRLRCVSSGASEGPSHPSGHQTGPSSIVTRFNRAMKKKLRKRKVFKGLIMYYLVFTPCLLDIDPICLCFSDGQALCQGATGRADAEVRSSL